jgi:DNA repair photolyase
MWETAHSVPSAYNDTFDYRMYDRLYKRFGDRQPRGGVVYKGTMKLLEAQDCAHCFYRFEIDTYGRGCVHNCAYCYARSYLSIRRYWNEPIPFPIDIAAIRKIFATVFETSKPNKFRPLLEKRVPLRLGSMSDTFMWMDKKYRVTLELLKILRFYRYPYIIFTRSDLVADDEYLREMDPQLASVQMSISSINDRLTRQLEPGAPAPRKRLQALQKLAAHGFWTAVRINPLFPIYPDGYYTNSHFDHATPVKPFNFFSWDMIEVIARHKVPTVLVGVVRLYRPNLRFMSKALGYDVRALFADNVQEERASLHFSAAETAYYYTKIKELCDAYGLRFSTCYIGNEATGESFYHYQHLWSNRTDCCDAVGNVPAFKTTCADVRAYGTKLPLRLRLQRAEQRPFLPLVDASGPCLRTVRREAARMQTRTVTLPGINLQAPWAQALVSGQKVIETRFYPMPEKWVGQPLVIIETPGKAGRFRSRIAGVVIFGPSWCYADKAAFARDRARHLVDPDDPHFGWREGGKPKWAWPVRWIEAYQQPLPAGFRAGIRYARAVEVLRPSAALLERLARINPGSLEAYTASPQPQERPNH